MRGDVIRGVECYRIRRMESRSECTIYRARSHGASSVIFIEMEEEEESFGTWSSGNTFHLEQPSEA